MSVDVVLGHDWSMIQWSRGRTREAVARRARRARCASEPRRGAATFVDFASVDSERRSIDRRVEARWVDARATRTEDVRGVILVLVPGRRAR